jgi:dihydroorotase
MIDPHVHLRDGKQSSKETVEHGLEVAYLAGLDGVFEMPNTDPPLTSEDDLLARIGLGNEAAYKLRKKYYDFSVFHGVYAGLTPDLRQIREVVKAQKEHFPRIVGLKAFFGQSTGNLRITAENEQRLVWKAVADMGYKGVLAGHCEKESELRPDLWDSKKPFMHTLARPPKAEVESIKDQIKFAQAAKYKGTFHVCHVSVPEALEYIESVRNDLDFQVTCGLTPHHALLYDEMMKQKMGLLLKMNPPLRPREMQEYMLKALLDERNERIDWIETDHAPHTLDDKTSDKQKTYASGIPVLPFYPHFLSMLREKGMSKESLERLTHDNISNAFRIDVQRTIRAADMNLQKKYDFDAFESLNNNI